MFSHMHRKCQSESAIQGKSTLANPDDAEEEDDILLDDARMWIQQPM